MTTPAATDTERDYEPGRWGIDQRTWMLVALLGLLVVVAGVLVVFVTWVGSIRDDKRADIAADLREKYGLTVVGLPNTRLAEPAVWTIDGDRRNCVYDRDDTTLECLDADGVYAEIERSSSS